MDIRISEEPLPGIGRRYELRVAADRSLSVIVQQDGARPIVVLGAGADEPEFAVRLNLEQAVALAALLMGRGSPWAPPRMTGSARTRW